MISNSIYEILHKHDAVTIIEKDIGPVGSKQILTVNKLKATINSSWTLILIFDTGISIQMNAELASLLKLEYAPITIKASDVYNYLVVEGKRVTTYDLYTIVGFSIGPRRYADQEVEQETTLVL